MKIKFILELTATDILARSLGSGAVNTGAISQQIKKLLEGTFAVRVASCEPVLYETTVYPSGWHTEDPYDDWWMEIPEGESSEVMRFNNCGHKTGVLGATTNKNGYTLCYICEYNDTTSALQHCNRAEVLLDGSQIRSASGSWLGTVVERVQNSGARTPTGGRYQSDKMTIVDKWHHKWFANAPKVGRRITLRRAEA